MSPENEQDEKRIKQELTHCIDELTQRLIKEDRNWMEIRYDLKRRVVVVKFLDVSAYGIEHMIKDEVYRITDDGHPSFVECYDC
ncbi:hypothetical protein JW756_03785 [Candidatus Woesearchaeota archaeon]|nr:hypothetical protein [Candidatus Woesearchaeota archaeon]